MFERWWSVDSYIFPQCIHDDHSCILLIFGQVISELCYLMQDYIRGIRATYTKDFNSKDATKRQIAVATYLIDKLALRAGNEKVISYKLKL